MLVDIFLTTCGRTKLFSESFLSFLDSTPRNLYRLTVVVDGGIEKGTNYTLFDKADYVLWSSKNIGLGPSINRALSHISSLNTYFDNQKSDFICMCQDDIIYQKGWLEKLLKVYTLFSKRMKLGFVSGHECVEHPTKDQIKFGNATLLVKDWIRATCMLTTTEYFLS